VTNEEIANVIRDFVLDIGSRLGSFDDPIVEEMRKFADRVEFGDVRPAEVKPEPAHPHLHKYGEER